MTSIRGVWRKLRWSLMQRGVAGTVRASLSRLRSKPDDKRLSIQHPFDVKYGVDTSGLISGGDLGVGHAHDAYITAYAGIAPSRFFRALLQWKQAPPVAPPERYTFIDLGCGKGRAVMMAAELGFAEVIGVELNTELARVATANVEVWKKAGRAHCPVRIVCGDATEVEIPEGPCLVFMWNPFGAPVMRRLLERLEARVPAGSGTLDVLYQNPEQKVVFAATTGFQLLWSMVIAASDEDAAVDPVATKLERCNMYRR